MAERLRVEESLVRIVRSVLEPNEACCEIDISDWDRLMALAKKNSIFPYVYRYIKQLPEEKRPSADRMAYIEQLDAMDLQTAVLQDFAIDTIREGLEEKGIDHLFFKGSVTKDRYPDRFLRTMGDIDFLYRDGQHEALCEQMTAIGFERKSVGRVHDVYTNASAIHIEAHRRLMSSNSPYFAYWKEIWERVTLRVGRKHEYVMTLEDEFLFNFIHLASHFKRGGIGIRFVADMWIYKQLDLDRTYIEEQLKELKLLSFFHILDALAEKWFGIDREKNSLVDEVEAYILSGGTFGNREHRTNASVRDGRLRYFFKVCFPSYEDMQSMFPSLKSRAMLPFAWIRRIAESAVNRRGNVKVLMNPMQNSDKNSAAAIKDFFVRCGLE